MPFVCREHQQNPLVRKQAFPAAVLLWLPAPLYKMRPRISQSFFLRRLRGRIDTLVETFGPRFHGPSFSCCRALLRRRSDGQPAKEIPEIALIPSPTPAGCRTRRVCSLDQPNWETRSLFGKRSRGALYILLVHTEVADGLSPMAIRSRNGRKEHP